MRIIDADKLLKDTIYNPLHAPYITKKDVEEASTIDAVPVVRCRSCRYYNTACCNEGCGWCENSNLGTLDEWYCADGETEDECC